MAHELEIIYFRQRSMINKLPHVLAQSVIIWALLQFPPNKKQKKTNQDLCCGTMQRLQVCSHSSDYINQNPQVPKAH